VGSGEDLWEAWRVRVGFGDAVVKDDDGAGGEIFCYEPADVPGGRV